MKNKSFIKSYGLLLLAIGACITGLIFLGINIFVPSTVVMKDLTSLNKEEVLLWVNDNNLKDLITYDYEYSTEVDEGMVISQSLDPKSKIEDSFNVVISKGSKISLDNLEYPDKNSFDTFISKYKDVKVIYEEEENDLEKGKIIKFSKSTIDLKNDEITIILSLGKDNTEDENDDKKEEDNKDDKNKVLIPDNLLGIEEAKFIKTLNDLGFKNLKKDSQKYYSFKSAKDTIFSYDDGKFETDRTINYAISLGDYVSAFNKSDYENKTLEEANKVIKKYNDLNAHITIKTTNKETSDTSKVGLLTNLSCTKDGMNSLIKCDIYIKEDKSATIPDNLKGKSKDEFINALKALGFNNFNQNDSKYSSFPLNTICNYDSGTKKVSATISYTLSLGTYSANASDYNGKTLNDANSFVNNLKNKGATVNFTYTTVEDLTKENGKLFDCSVANSSNITCKLASNRERFYIPRESFFKQTYGPGAGQTSFDACKSAIEAVYKSNFPSIQIVGEASEYAPGTIIDVIVGGNTAYSAGNYTSDTSIKIIISNEQEN